MVRSSTLFPVLAAVLSLLHHRIHAQVDGTFDPTFVQGTGFAGDVYTIARQADGKLLIAGDELSLYNGTQVPAVVRLGADGALDTSFDAGDGPDGRVHRIAVQADGRILVGGTFFNFDGVPSRRLVRLMPNGSVDGTFAIGTAANDWVDDLVIQPDGRILVAGHFDQFNGVNVGGIVRLMADGSIDPSFNTGTGAEAEVNAIALRTDGRMVLGGYFSSFNGLTRNKVVQLNANGSVDTDFDPGAGGGSGVSIRAVAIAADGRVLCGGDLFTWAGATANGLVRLNTDGSRDMGFDASATTQYGVLDAIIQSDGHILFCGAQGVERVTSTGADDPTFDTGSGFFGGLQVVVDLEALPDGRVLAGGQFDDYDGHAVGSIVRLTSADVGVPEHDSSTLRVWPDPSDGVVRLSATGAGTTHSVHILDMSGQVVEPMRLIRDGDELRLPSTPGAYIVEVHTAEGDVTRLRVIRE